MLESPREPRERTFPFPIVIVEKRRNFRSAASNGVPFGDIIIITTIFMHIAALKQRTPKVATQRSKPYERIWTAQPRHTTDNRPLGSVRVPCHCLESL